MKLRSTTTAILVAVSLTACGGASQNGGNGGNTAPPDPNHPNTYNGNYYYAAVTGAADSFALPNLPANSSNQVQWNSIALLYNTGSGTWTVAMNQPNYYPNVGHPVLMGPFSGVWTTLPRHAFQYRVTNVEWQTGNTDNANPINGGVPYDIFQPAAPTDWISMPADSTVNLCSVSTNSVYTSYLGGGSIACTVEVMDMTASTVTASTVHLSLIKDSEP